ncbi:GDSL esterase/lipase At1g29670-like [Nymphaea colorata]|nr:GDSL esterase/lipase At1g29670-like [Nymphaea colorata]
MPTHFPSSPFHFFSIVLVSTLYLLFFLPSSGSTRVVFRSAEKKKNAAPLFVFGDSMVDNGNNVFLPNPEAKFDFLPYGVDFAEGPTGRLTNGMNPADVMAQLLNLPAFLPAAKDPLSKGERILNGLNYASGGSGILDSVADISACISLNQQIEHFRTATVRDLSSQLREKGQQLASFLSKSIFMFNAGGNDCSWMCSQANSGDGQCTAQEFLQSLLANFTQQLKAVYGVGARKFVLFGVQAIGCTPFARAASGMKDGYCKEEMNNAAISFNKLLSSSLGDLEKRQMPGSRIVYVDTYKIVRDVFDNPAPLGFRVINQTCCRLSKSSQNKMCEEGSAPCEDRDAYMYFDGVHFTEALYKHLAGKAYLSELSSEVYPYNVARLVDLELGPAASSNAYAETESHASS